MRILKFPKSMSYLSYTCLENIGQGTNGYVERTAQRILDRLHSSSRAKSCLPRDPTVSSIRDIAANSCVEILAICGQAIETGSEVISAKRGPLHIRLKSIT